MFKKLLLHKSTHTTKLAVCWSARSKNDVDLNHWQVIWEEAYLTCGLRSIYLFCNALPKKR